MGAIDGGGKNHTMIKLPPLTFNLKIFGPNWRCPSPVVLHIGNPDPPKLTHTPAGTICPMWKKSNELFGKVFSYRGNIGPSTQASGTHNSLLASSSLQKPPPAAAAEAGLLYLGIKDGWANLSDEVLQSPALAILRQVDEHLFARLPHMERLALAYKSYKLLKVSLDIRISLTCFRVCRFEHEIEV